MFAFQNKLFAAVSNHAFQKQKSIIWFSGNQILYELCCTELSHMWCLREPGRLKMRTSAGVEHARFNPPFFSTCCHSYIRSRLNAEHITPPCDKDEIVVIYTIEDKHYELTKDWVDEFDVQLCTCRVLSCYTPMFTSLHKRWEKKVHVVTPARCRGGLRSLMG